MKKRWIALLLAVCLTVSEESMVVQAEITDKPVAVEAANREELSQEDEKQPVDRQEEGQQEEIQQEDQQTEEQQADGQEEIQQGEPRSDGQEEIQQIGDQEEEQQEEPQSDGQKELQKEESGLEKGILEELESEEGVTVEKLSPSETEEFMEGREDKPEFEFNPLGANDVYEQEYNNSLNEANALSLGTTVHGSITNNDPVDFYKVTLPAAGELKLKIHSKLECYTVAVYEEGTGYYLYWENNWWNSSLQEITNTHSCYLEGGTWYIQITGYKYFQNAYDYDYYAEDDDEQYYVDYIGDYTCGITYQKSSLTEKEPNDTWEQANTLNFGKTITGQLSCKDKMRDYYKIDVKKQGKVTLGLTAWIKQYDLYLYSSERDEDGYLTRLWYDDDIYWDSNKEKSVNAWEFYLTRGTYYICLRCEDYSVYDGLYKINASFTDSKTTFDGNHDSAAAAKKINWNKTYTGQISLNDQLDLYKITMSSGRNVPMTMTSYMYSYRARIYNASGAEVWNSGQLYREDGKTKRRDDFVITLGRGTYYLEITDGSDYYTDTGIYKFNFSAGSLSSLKLNKNKLKMTQGSTYKLKTIMYPAAVKVDWKSGNSKVVSVKSGKLTAKGYGTAKITCTAKDGSKKTASCTVTVVPAKAKIKSVKNTKSGKKITIQSLSGVTGYEVYSKTKRNSWKLYKNIKGAKNKSFTVKKSYYNSHSFRVRAYKQVGSKKYYGAYSKTL